MRKQALSYDLDWAKLLQNSMKCDKTCMERQPYSVHAENGQVHINEHFQSGL